jgi:hypothetical protein
MIMAFFTADKPIVFGVLPKSSIVNQPYFTGVSASSRLQHGRRRQRRGLPSVCRESNRANFFAAVSGDGFLSLCLLSNLTLIDFLDHDISRNTVRRSARSHSHKTTLPDSVLKFPHCRIVGVVATRRKISR